MKVLFIQDVSGVHTSASVDTDELKMALQVRKVSGASRNGPQDISKILSYLEKTQSRGSLSVNEGNPILRVLTLDG